MATNNETNTAATAQPEIHRKISELICHEADKGAEEAIVMLEAIVESARIEPLRVSIEAIEQLVEADTPQERDDIFDAINAYKDIKRKAAATRLEDANMQLSVADTPQDWAAACRAVHSAITHYRRTKRFIRRADSLRHIPLSFSLDGKLNK